MAFDNFKKSFNEASTTKKIGLGLGVAVGALFLPHAAAIAAVGGLGYAGYQGAKAVSKKNDGPAQ